MVYNILNEFEFMKMRVQKVDESLDLVMVLL